MKVGLVVMQGAHQGKEIPIAHSQFIIGRDPQCQLRPASSMISRRHCALLTRQGKVFLRDFGSTNGTHVNDQRVDGERELRDGDRIRIDPLVFQIRIQQVIKTMPEAATDSATDDSIAAMLLEVQEDGSPVSTGTGISESDVPMGTTVMQLPTRPTEEMDGAEKKPSVSQEKRPEPGNTASAAKILLEKYHRRKKP
jgi:pSer/pThr/pTyr-binding forkhead associated (FHA) protein